MKTLTLLRHAKSSWDDPVARDFDRPLNRRGRKAAHAMGREMRAQGLRFDSVLASPATRVAETIREVGETYGGALEPLFKERIYLATAETLLELVRATDESVERLLLVGHSPGMEKLALLLSEGSGGALRAQVAVKYPTAALAEIALPVERWSDVRAGIGRIDRFTRPRDLDPGLGPED